VEAARLTWRLLVTGPADGATNMAVDEALFRGRQAGTSPPTLRVFAWAPPTVSVGYGQPLDRHLDVAACRALGVGLVRRPTGGSAIYHDGPERELTYSVVAAADDLGETDSSWEGGSRPPTPPGDLLGTYHWIARALCRALRDLGAPVEIVAVPVAGGPTPAFCFARTGRYELEIGGRKVVGSAQRRQGRCFLQHGSVLLGVDLPRLAALFPTTADPLATMTTLEAALGRRPTFAECAEALARAFAAEHGLTLVPGGLRDDERRQADRLERERYRTDAWLQGPGETLPGVGETSEPLRPWLPPPSPSAGWRPPVHPQPPSTSNPPPTRIPASRPPLQ
jgi:lipoate-protein ligase A